MLDLLDFRLVIFPHTHTHTRETGESPEARFAKEGVRLVLLSLVAAAEVCPFMVSVLASRATEARLRVDVLS